MRGKVSEQGVEAEGALCGCAVENGGTNPIDRLFCPLESVLLPITIERHCLLDEREEALVGAEPIGDRDDTVEKIGGSANRVRLRHPGAPAKNLHHFGGKPGSERLVFLEHLIAPDGLAPSHLRPYEVPDYPGRPCRRDAKRRAPDLSSLSRASPAAGAARLRDRRESPRLSRSGVCFAIPPPRPQRHASSRQTQFSRHQQDRPFSSFLLWCPSYRRVRKTPFPLLRA